MNYKMRSWKDTKLVREEVGTFPTVWKALDHFTGKNEWRLDQIGPLMEGEITATTDDGVYIQIELVR